MKDVWTLEELMEMSRASGAGGVHRIPGYLKRRRALPAQCAKARKQQGGETRTKSLRQWHASPLPERERAAAIAKSLDISERHVRRVLKMAGLK
jgi:hypothetical protein